MIVSFLNADLSRWDQLLRDRPAWPSCIGLPFFEDERPLRGAAGLCDWRLGGRLSRLLGARIGPQRDDRGEGVRVRGQFGEKLLLPTGTRLPFGRLILFGLGSSKAFDEARAKIAARELLGSLRALVPPGSEQHFAMVPPGRSTGALSARQALEVLLAEAEPLFDGPSARRGTGDDHAAETQARLTVVESTAGQKEAAELARRFAVADIGSAPAV